MNTYTSFFHRPVFAVATLLVLSPLFAQETEYRNFTNTAGKSIRAKVNSIQDGKVSITMEGGKEFTIPITSLSEADGIFLKEWAEKEAAKPEGTALTDTGDVTVDMLNEIIGQDLFAETTLWTSNPEEVAGRLKWKRESKTEDSESYRSYPPADYKFLGARPYSVALYGGSEKVTGISLVFANKGDSFGSRAGGEEHFIKGKPVPGGMEGLRIIMENDAELIATALTEKLGEPTRQKFGEGESRVNVKRWDWAGHSFLLSNVEDEYVSLAVQTTEFADARGRVARVPDSVVRARTRGNIKKRENGDVVISNIPMVDQGPKGYCVPATAERCMRFLGISADMYLLAMAGETTAGGGTSVDRLLNNIGRDIKRKGRSFDIFDGELKIRTIKKHIDKGIPIIWAISSSESFNKTANERTSSRKTDEWASYKKTVLAAAENPGLMSDPSRNHVVIIMGYNEETNEVAFSDSWGERYLERWITIPEGEQISNNRFYVIGL